MTSPISTNHPSRGGITTRLMCPDRVTPIICLLRSHTSRSPCSRISTARIDSLSPSDEGFTYGCQGPGALLSLPHDGHREDVVRTKAFEDYVRDNVVSWFNWSKNQKLPVDSMEDLILVTGFTLVESWAAVAFIGRSRMAKLSLIVTQTPNGNGRSFECNNIQGDVAQHCSFFDSVCFPYSIFSPCTDPFLCRIEREMHPQCRINASSSGASERSGSSSGLDPSGLQQDPFLTTLTIAVGMRSTRPEFQTLKE
jgi:hypothetical protein